MGLPSKRRTSTSRDQRRAHHALKSVTTARCQSCGAVVLPHRACLACGKYRGRTVIKKAAIAKK